MCQVWTAPQDTFWLQMICDYRRDGVCLSVLCNTGVLLVSLFTFQPCSALFAVELMRYNVSIRMNFFLGCQGCLCGTRQLVSGCR
jgi:hypothetical protein